jgi:hypothetical protein
MLFNPEHEDALGQLTQQLCLSQVVTPDLLAVIIAAACTRFSAMSKAGKAARLDSLIKAEAWSDAALADRIRTTEMEASPPRLRGWRMVLFPFQTTELPAVIDEIIDAHHEILPVGDSRRVRCGTPSKFRCSPVVVVHNPGGLRRTERSYGW